MKKSAAPKQVAKREKPGKKKSVRGRIEDLFLVNVGKVVTRAQILEAARDPDTGIEPENWHQRLSEMRTDMGYTILSHRDRRELKVEDYLMPHTERRVAARGRVRPSEQTCNAV